MSLMLSFSAIVVFIGHGSDPHSASQMPPSSDENTGRLIFLSREPKQALNTWVGNVSSPSTMADSSSTNYKKTYDDLSSFQLAAGKTLFICQACYSGNRVNKMAKGKYGYSVATCMYLYNSKHADFVVHVANYT